MNISLQTKGHDGKDINQDDEEQSGINEKAGNNQEQFKSAREKEVCAKSVSRILLILLKWSKSSRKSHNWYFWIKILTTRLLISNLIHCKYRYSQVRVFITAIDRFRIFNVGHENVWVAKCDRFNQGKN